jgi:hypothetical protein
VSFAAITPCVASRQVFVVVISLSTQSGNFWIYPRIVCFLLRPGHQQCDIDCSPHSGDVTLSDGL